MPRAAMVGREAQRRWLVRALAGAREGRGGLVLVTGEAGVGKTRLCEEALEESGLRVLRGRALHGDRSPYAPIAAALRQELRGQTGLLSACGPLSLHLATILPELGDPPPGGDRATLFEAVRQAMEGVACDGAAAVLLDDLQWSDAATLDLLAALADALAAMPLLVVGAYRADGLPRDHPVRRMRHELRRAGRLEELALEPLGADGTALLAAEVLGAPPAPSLAAAIQDRTLGVPFFVEELARALVSAGALEEGPGGLVLAGDDVPIPDTVRDAVLIGAAELSPAARAAADAAAVVGARFDPELVAALSDAAGLGELVERGWVHEEDGGRGAFRHALVREAVYADVPWVTRRALHRRLAEALEAAGAPSRELATHWLGARDTVRARAALLRAARESAAVHAHRDAARAFRQALELWPEGEAEEDARLVALEGYADSAELAGDLPEAARAWREVALVRSAEGDAAGLGRAKRRLAGVHDLRADRDAALAVRTAAAEAFAAAGMPAEAAIERLGAAAHRRARAEYAAAIALARAAHAEARTAGRDDLRARALGLEGVARAKAGDHARGLAVVREGLALALAGERTAVAAELYQRLGLALYDSGDYVTAQTALDSALALCRTGGEEEVEVACVTCMVYVLRERGEWARALELGRDLIAAGRGVWVAEGLVGAIQAYQGRLAVGRRLLLSSLATSGRVGHFNMAVDSTAALAWIAAASGDDEEAGRRCREILARWQRSEDHHYAVRGLRWAASHFARSGLPDDARACGEALGRIAGRTGHPDALAALAHAIGEAALAEGDAATAADQMSRALDLHRGIEITFDRAEIGVRAGVALAAAGDREGALERLGEGHRTARRLGARPLASEAAREVAALGESVAARLGRRAEADAEGGGLSRRELEVVRLVATGRTNREIARDLYLSPRTVDMHVRGILRRLGCRSRTEAARRAGELGLLGHDGRPA